MTRNRTTSAQKIIAFCLLLAACCSFACSVPNLEEPECDQARDRLREFYSLHFGNNMLFSEAEFEKRKIYLTPRFVAELKANADADPFTLYADQPKAFRVGKCFVTEPGRKVRFNVALFWKTDTRSEQQIIGVEAEKIDDQWLIDSVRNVVFSGANDF